MAPRNKALANPDCAVINFPPSFAYPKLGPNATLDPFEMVLVPPQDETPDEHEARLNAEQQARQVSEQIDRELKAERDSRRKGRRKIVRLLLLGQSESGKSTTLRQFQRLYTPTAFREERVLWRAVIQLNIVRSVLTILSALDIPSSPPHGSVLSRKASHATQNSVSASRPRRARRNQGYPSSDEEGNRDATSIRMGKMRSPSSSPPPPPNLERRRPSLPGGGLSPEIQALRPRLAALKDVEAILISSLIPTDEDGSIPERTNGNGPTFVLPRGEGLDLGQEISVPGGDGGWRGALQRAKLPLVAHLHVQNAMASAASDDEAESSEGDDPANVSWSASVAQMQRSESIARKSKDKGKARLDPNDPQSILHSLKREMIALWENADVREILERRKVRVWEEPGFFLNDLERVTSLRYMPTDEDVLRARLKTVGVSEYKFEMEVAAGRDAATEWRIIDIGGSRGQRPAWVSFFDDVDAIIFLAPICGFDQVLTEDRTVNRLEDSVLLWKALCSNKLLANVDLVLFLNKCDILEQKLNSGVRLERYLKSYGDRPNDLDNVSRYLRSKFSAIHREYSPSQRKFYVWLTSVTDPSTTSGIIASVRDMVIRQHLKQSRLL